MGDEMKEFSKDELKKHNGEKEQPAYVALDGKVYDVTSSKMWNNGEHMGRHNAGADLSKDFPEAPHGTEVFERVKLVGTIVEEPVPGEKPAVVTKSAPGWARWILGFHPHPIMVHFPQAAFAFAPFFLFLFYLTGNQSFERTAYYMLLCGVVTLPPAYITGLFHWIYKYSKVSGGIYIFKLMIGQALIVLSLVTAYTHKSAGKLSPDSPNIQILVLYVLMVMIAASLGHAGGIIVFGRKK